MVINMSSSTGVIILEMERLYSTQEALDVIMHSECEDGSSSTSEDSEADMEEPQRLKLTSWSPTHLKTHLKMRAETRWMKQQRDGLQRTKKYLVSHKRQNMPLHPSSHRFDPRTDTLCRCPNH